MLNFCDVQLLTGFAVVLAGFVTLQSGVSTYHWKILTYTACFSTITHLATLTTLRDCLCKRPMERLFRLIAIYLLLGVVIGALVLTGLPPLDQQMAPPAQGQNTPDRQHDCQGLFINSALAYPALCLLQGHRIPTKIPILGQNLKVESIVTIVLLLYNAATKSIRLLS